MHLAVIALAFLTLAFQPAPAPATVAHCLLASGYSREVPATPVTELAGVDAWRGGGENVLRYGALLGTARLTNSDGSNPDLTADSVKWTIKRRGLPDAQAILIVTGDVATSGAAGIVLFEVSDETTAPLAAGTYVSDVVWRLANGDEYVVLRQNIVITERVSDP